MLSSAHAAVQIAAKPTQNMSCLNGVCSPTGKKAVLDVNDVANMLASGDVEVISDKSTLDISFDAALTWTSSHRLSVDAYRSIIFSKPLKVAGSGALSLSTDDGGTNGDLTFRKGKVEFRNLSSSLTINGQNYLLFNSITQLAQDANNNPDGLFALAKSYDATGDGAYMQPPVPQLKGVLEGLGNGIRNFSLALQGDGSFGGLFGVLFPSSAVRDLSLQDVRIDAARASAEQMGSLGGDCYGLIKGVTVTGTMVGSGQQDTVGGIAGETHGTVAESHAKVAISNAVLAGDLVGLLLSIGRSPAAIVNSSATGDVTGGTAGGLVGATGNTVEAISSSFATGNVGTSLSAGGELGGLLGSGGASISASFATGNVSASSCAACGGLIGSSAGSIANSYSTGVISAANCSACGGLIGANSGNIATSYSTGAVNASGGFEGGLIGDDSSAPASLSETYWDLDTSGIGDSAAGAGNVRNDPGIAGLTDAQLKSGLPQGFSQRIWSQGATVNNGYPYLLASSPR
jgi:hypothetical protein